MTSVAPDGTAVAAQLRNLFPTVGKRSSFGGKSNKAKKPLKKTKKDIVHKDVVLLPSLDTRSVPTHQMRCRLENNGFVIHAFPVDKSLQETDFRAQIKDLFPHLGETNFDFVKPLASGVYFSALRVLGLAGQGSIYIFHQKVISPLPFTVTLTVLPRVLLHLVKPQAQVHFLMRDVAFTQALRALQLLVHVRLAMEPIRKGSINKRRCSLTKATPLCKVP